MRTSRRQRATTVIVVLAVLLGSLWAGGLAVPAAGGPAIACRTGTRTRWTQYCAATGTRWTGAGMWYRWMSCGRWHRLNTTASSSFLGFCSTVSATRRSCCTTRAGW